MHELWVEKYRPKTVDDYVFKDATQEQQVKGWVKDGGIPHLLLHGGPGTGKTTLARVLVNDLDIEDGDFMYINASRDNGIETIRKKITSFSETMAWGKFKIILLDEADHISSEGQAALRGVMEQYHSVVRFILTCNYPNRIIPAIHSRCQTMNITNMDQTDFTVRVAEILGENNVNFDLDTIDNFVKACYPDLRKTINSVQQGVVNGTLKDVAREGTDTSDWRLQMVALFRDGKIKAARQLISKNITADEYEDIFVWLYRNLEFFGANDDQQDEAVIIIRNGLVKHTQVADPEINLSATLIELERIGK